MSSPSAAASPTTAADAIAALDEARERTLALVATVSDEDLERVHSTLMSPLVWDLGHIAAFEDLWLVHRFGGRPLLRDDLAEVYDAFETPRAGRGELPFLRAAGRARVPGRGPGAHARGARGARPGDGRPSPRWSCATSTSTTRRCSRRFSSPTSTTTGSRGTPRPARAGAALTGLELIEVPAGACTIGARRDGLRLRQRAARATAPTCAAT